MTCSSCGGDLEATRIFRRHWLLVVMGFALLATGLYLTATGILVLLATPLSSPDEVLEASIAKIKAEAVEKLRAMECVPPEAIAEFEETGHIGTAHLEGLPKEKRARVRQVVAGLHAKNLLVAPSTALGTVFLQAMVVIFLVGGTVALFLGWLLLRRRNILRCVECGTIVPLTKTR